MSNYTVTADPEAIRLAAPDATPLVLPLIWLRDNCPSGLHPETQERTLDLLSLPEVTATRSARIEAGALVVDWAGEAHQSRYPLDWILRNAPGTRADDPAAIPPELWDGTLGAGGVPRYEAAEILSDDGALLAWMRDAGRLGLSIVEGIAGGAEAGIAVAERIGFLRRTNFGTTFEVQSKPDPNNLAYTAVALPLHTDLPNQEVPPGFQFLHAIANEAVGGGSLFADGFAIARQLSERDPGAFALLSEVPIPFRFHDGDTDIRSHRPVITLAPDGALQEIRWNAHIAGVFDMAPSLMGPYYRAYRAFMALTRDPAFVVSLKLSAGEMVVFDNRRVLHGRAAFDPSTGFRYLHGCYVDRGEFDSRLRQLAREEHGLAENVRGSHESATATCQDMDAPGEYPPPGR